ncbi:hypothetical protein ARMGADRAFT_1086660 [Armillaria gallica]|uniref:Uncharacterized protein n=1 Tax=Armillaria gallica TaxID=47427 RepID=A0A2H3CTW5_ARMGA|nr:hypothetical protein ARMGADRAFT_1086660 [Armillaria gallica]
MTQRKVMPLGKSEVVSNSCPSDSTKAFQKDWSSPLHSKPAQLKIGPLINTSRSGASTRASSWVLVVNATDRPNVIQGPDPDLSPLREGNTVVPSSVHQPLFFPGTDDEEGQIQEDLVTGGAALFEDDGLADNFSNLDDNEPNAPQDELMDLDRDESLSGDEEPSPPPMNIAHRLCQAPRILFVFDKATGDFVEPHPTIFIPRLTASPVPSQDLRRSARSHGSPVSPDTAYLKAVQGSKVDMTKKKKKKDVKGKGHATETKVPHKHARPKDDTSQVKDKPASKKPKLKETVVINRDEPAIATKAVRRRGPGLSRPLPVTLGVSGGGFGEKVLSSAKEVTSSIKSIGVLVVDKDFGEFVEVDKSYWSKAVVSFIGEWYTTPCDHCRRLGTQCRKLLTHSVKCVHCHYSKLPCKVNGVTTLNPVEHYRPKGYDVISTFESTLITIEANNAAISEITQQYLASLSLFVHMDNIHAQASRLCCCLDPVEDEEDEEDYGEDGADTEHEAPDDVAEGISGPSKKKKSKSC